MLYFHVKLQRHLKRHNTNVRAQTRCKTQSTKHENLQCNLKKKKNCECDKHKTVQKLENYVRVSIALSMDLFSIFLLLFSNWKHIQTVQSADNNKKKRKTTNIIPLHNDL